MTESSKCLGPRGWRECQWRVMKRRIYQEAWRVQLVKNPPAMQETWVWSLGWEDSLEKGKATHSNILTWEFHALCSPWGCKESDTTEQISFHMKGPMSLFTVWTEVMVLWVHTYVKILQTLSFKYVQILYVIHTTIKLVIFKEIIMSWFCFASFPSLRDGNHELLLRSKIPVYFFSAHQKILALTQRISFSLKKVLSESCSPIP